MFRIRWRITLCLLELGLRVMLLTAFFARSELRRPGASRPGALGLAPALLDSSVLLIGALRPTGVVEARPNREKIGA